MNKWLQATLILGVSCVVLGCKGEGVVTSESKSPESSGVDTRVSSHGKTRPTIASSTEFEDVEYFNPETGTRSTYNVEVDRDSDGTVQRINWPNSGWLEISGDTVDNHDGTETFTRDDGCEYTLDHKEDSDKDDDADSTKNSDDDSDSDSENQSDE
jgi:hypothetical protein